MNENKTIHFGVDEEDDDNNDPDDDNKSQQSKDNKSNLLDNNDLNDEQTKDMKDKPPNSEKIVELLDKEIDKILIDDKSGSVINFKDIPVLKKDKITLYFSLCEKYKQTPIYTRNKLRKTRNPDLDMLLYNLKNKQQQTKDNKDNKDQIPTSTTNTTINSTINSNTKKLAAKNLYKLNCMLMWATENLSESYLKDKNLSIDGVSADIMDKSSERALTPIMENIVSEYPDMCNNVANPFLQWGVAMGTIMAKRIHSNRINKPINNIKKKQCLRQKQTTNTTNRNNIRDRRIIHIRKKNHKNEKEIPILQTFGKKVN